MVMLFAVVGALAYLIMLLCYGCYIDLFDAVPLVLILATFTNVVL